MIRNVGTINGVTFDYTKVPITEFVSHNFSDFATKYNECHNEKLIATKIIRNRGLILEDNYVYYFDFDYGYMVASEDYEILLISNYDLPFRLIVQCGVLKARY